MPHAFKADEGDWRQIKALHPAESTPYVGRAVVVPARNGRVAVADGQEGVSGTPGRELRLYRLRGGGDRQEQEGKHLPAHPLIDLILR